MNMSFSLSGTQELGRALERLGAQAHQAAAAELYLEAEAVMADSKENFVPVDLGILRNSGYVAPPAVNGSEIVVELGYGGAAKDYAWIQHEREDFHHDVGQAKYLERPLLYAVRGMAGRLARGIRSRLGL